MERKGLLLMDPDGRPFSVYLGYTETQILKKFAKEEGYDVEDLDDFELEKISVYIK